MVARLTVVIGSLLLTGCMGRVELIQITAAAVADDVLATDTHEAPPGPEDHEADLVCADAAEEVISFDTAELTGYYLAETESVGPCTVATIECAEGTEVIPQTTLHFFGDESCSPQGGAAKWEWKVTQPAGSQSVFVPSASFPNPTFEANVAGIYTFSLNVWDEQGAPSSFPAGYVVTVIPDEAIHVELLWHTPEDMDESDTGPEAGSDLDLHFLHPWASGPDVDGDGKPDGWFDIPFDAFWFNAHPNWGSYDPAINDDPGLDRDDTEGAGPENINLDIPEHVTYRVGVHYWNDHGYGPSYVTVRVYIYGQLVFEEAGVKLVDADMWEVCTIEWPSGQVHPVTSHTGSKITPGYHNPYFSQ